MGTNDQLYKINRLQRFIQLLGISWRIIINLPTKISFKRWIPVLLVMALIFCFSNTPAEKVSQLSGPGIEQINKIIVLITGKPVQEPGFDWLKVGHVIGYFLLGASFHFALSQYPKLKGSQFLALALCFVYALTDEFHQMFVPGRSPRFTDVLIDSSAASLALLVIIIVRQIRKRRMETNMQNG